MTQNERQLKAVEEELGKHAADVDELLGRAEKEERESTADERDLMEKHLKAIKELKAKRADIQESIKVEQDVKETARKFGKSDPAEVSSPRVKAGGDHQDRMIKSIGEMFTDSAGYKALQDSYKEAGRLPQGASSGAVSFQTKGTLLEGAGGGGGALAATVPQVIPGVTDKLFQRLTVADLLLSGRASTNSLRYVVEGTATSGAAGVAEGGVKPESTLGLTTTDEPVKKIATILPISEEMLEDAPQVQSYINGRLTLFVKIEEERQLLRGAGTNEIVGIMPSGNTRGINIYAGGTAAGNKAVQLFKAINGTRGSALVEPNFVVMNPSDYQDIRLLADSSGQLFGGGPFFGPYGGPQGPASTGEGLVGAANEQVWGKTLVLTSALGAGTALVGSSSAAQVWRRGGLSVEATNAHSDYFQRNLVAIRAEERLALAVYRPSCFTETRLS